MKQSLYHILVLGSLCFFVSVQTAHGTGDCQPDLFKSQISGEQLMELTEEIFLLVERNPEISKPDMVDTLSKTMSLPQGVVGERIAVMESKGILRLRWENKTQREREQKVVEAVSPLFPAVIKLFSEDDATATGFFIGSRILVTSRHFIYDNSGILRSGIIYFRDPSTGMFVYTKILSIDQENDLALLETLDYESKYFYSVDSLDQKTLSLLDKLSDQAMRTDAVDEKVENFIMIPGFSRGVFNLWRGFLKKDFKDENTVLIDYKEVNSVYGASGGPVFFQDTLIGVAVGLSIPFGLSMFFKRHYVTFTPVEKLRDLIEKQNEKTGK